MPAADPRSTITRVLREPGSDQILAETVVPLLYTELRKIAAGLLARERRDHTLQCTDVVHEAYLRLFDQEKLRWNDRRHFLGCAASAMRRVLVDHARSKNAQKRIPREIMSPIELVGEPPGVQQPDHLEVHEALLQLEAIEPRLARTAELRYFGGLTEKEVAEVLGVSRRTVSRNWKVARVWLAHELG